MAGAERYRLIEVIGSGGMAAVWRGEDTELERAVAVKVISEHLALDETFMRRFTREAKIASSLSHPGLVPVFDYEPDAEKPFIVMELLEGGTLADRLGAEQPVDPRALAEQLLAALGHIHAAGIVHRDVKPANLLIDSHGAFRLTDFGIAQGEDATRYTRTGNVVGTLRYMAPEVKTGEPATAASDLYSAGVVISDAGGDEEGALAPLLAALTAVDPADRPPSAEAALALLGGEETEATVPLAAGGVEPTAPTQVIGAPGRGRAPYVLGALAALAGAALLAALLLGGGNDEPGDAAQSSQPQTETETTTEQAPAEQAPAAEAPATTAPENPAGQTPPGQAAGPAADCEQLEQQQEQLKEEGKAAAEEAGKDKEAEEAVKEDYKQREEDLKAEIEACKEAEKQGP